MGRTKLLLLVYLLCLSSSRIVAANPPPGASESAAIMCPRLSPLWRSALYLVVGRFDQTVTICEEMLRDNPNDPHVYAVRGYAHLLKRDNPHQAIADFTKVLRHDPANATMYVARGRAFEQTKEYDRSIADFTEAIRLDARNSYAYAFRAECYAWKKVTEKAIADYTAALRVDPELTWVRARRASLYFEQREWARSPADFDEVLRSNPDDREVKNNRCLANLFIYREYTRAFADANELIGADPREARWYWLRCFVYVAKREYIPACCDGIIALILNPRAIKIWIGPHSCGWVIGPSWVPNITCVPGDKPEKRIDDCTKQLVTDSNNLAAHYERAYAYLRKRDFKRAGPDLDEIIRLDPLDAQAYRLRGSVHFELREYTSALDDYTKAIQLDPNNGDGFTWRARTYGRMNKYEEALRDCAEALRLEPQSVSAFSVRGWIYYTSRQYERAIADYSEAIRLSPIDPDLYLRRGDARCSIWDGAGGIADYKQVVKLQPENYYACSLLAACLCVCPQADLRDGKVARRLATVVCKATSWRNWEALNLLALACAECGDFDEAVKWQTKAEELAPESEKQYNQERLKLYRAHKLYHPAPPQAASPSPSSK